MKQVFCVSLVFLALVALIPANTNAPSGNGPSYAHMLFDVSLNGETEYSKLKSGDIDVMDTPLTSSQVADALSDSNLVTVPASLNIHEFDLNHQMWPTSDLHFRRAVAYLVDKEKIVEKVLSRLGHRLDVPLPPALGAYIDSSVVYPNYRYEYNKMAAVNELTLMGAHFTGGKIDNWNSIPGSTGKSVIFVARADDLELADASLMLRAELVSLGVPIDWRLASKSVAGSMVMVQFNFNIYSGCWGSSRKEINAGNQFPGRDPDYLWPLYNGRFHYPGGPNYPGFNNPDYNFWSEHIATATDLQSATFAVRQAQNILIDQVGVIPLWSGSLMAYRKGIQNVVNAEDIGPNSWDTWFQSYKTQEYFDRGGKNPVDTIVYGFSSDIYGLNPVTAQWFWDWEVLNRIYEGLLKGDPYSLALDANWHTTGFEIGTWTYQGAPATRITYYLKPGLTWAGGSIDGTPVTGDDVAFSLLYHKQQQGWWWPNVMHVDHVNAEPAFPGDTSNLRVIVYMDIESIWALHWTGYVPILPMAFWQNVPDADEYDPIAAGTVIGYGPWKLVSRTAGVAIELDANLNYDYAQTTVTSMDQESFHRCGDVNYDGKVSTLDQAAMGWRYSATPYSPAPTYTVPAIQTIIGDQIGLIPATKAFADEHAFAPEDLTHDGRIYIQDFAIFGRNLAKTAG